ncbi:MAG: type I DNA topoisomerase [Candidatus Hepatoplasma vulgare]|nr:MAG: type I DNA topoisomerase [Candidatus Hepatoplasma sp.]
MTKNLIIVESPNKIAKIQSFFKGENDKEFKVISSVGHIRDLKKYGTYLGLGINVEEMEPIYVNLRDKKDAIKTINTEAKKANNIYIATDPDREGEAIGWHITQVIEDKNKKIKRIFFNEITKDAVLESLKNVTDIDMNLVNSQETRRMLDRIIGFRLSFLTNKKFSAPSAGRVKSSTLKLIIDRENEIKIFKPVFWWTIEAKINKDNILLNSDRNFKLIEYKDLKSVNAIFALLGEDFRLIDKQEKEIVVSSPVPLEMATYLMGMFTNFNISNVQATSTAQSLYEKGLITYPRTDSIRISSKSFIDSTKDKITKEFGKEYFGGIKESLIKKQKNIQDAHEAIRPTDINLKVENIKGLNTFEKKAYHFIWSITMKSMMSNGINKNINLLYQNNTEYFVNKIVIKKFLGYRILDTDIAEKEEKIEIKENLKIKKEDIKVHEHKTTPPPRYNQASIIKKLKTEGIGRPSTYSSTTSGLINYNYLTKESNNLVPTELAFKVNDLLLESFNDIVNEKYTASMETILDEISKGKVNGRNYLKDFWPEFKKRIEEVDQTIEKPIAELVNEKCPLDGGELVYKNSRYGKFIGCSNFPKCKYARKIEKEQSDSENKKDNKIILEEKCPISGHNLVIRKSRYNKSFIGCSNFPKCKFILTDKEKVKEIFEKYNIKE